MRMVHTHDSPSSLSASIIAGLETGTSHPVPSDVLAPAAKAMGLYCDVLGIYDVMNIDSLYLYFFAACILSLYRCPQHICPDASLSLTANYVHFLGAANFFSVQLWFGPCSLGTWEIENSIGVHHSPGLVQK